MRKFVLPPEKRAESVDEPVMTAAERIEFLKRRQKELAELAAARIESGQLNKPTQTVEQSTFQKKAIQTPSVQPPTIPTPSVHKPTVQKPIEENFDQSDESEKARQKMLEHRAKIDKNRERIQRFEQEGKGFFSFLLVNRHSLTSIIFLLFLFTGMLLHGLHPKLDFSEKERRQLQHFPDISTTNILDGTFMREFEDFSNDQMPYRDFFLSINRLYLWSMQRSDNGRVIFGGDDYLVKLNNPHDLRQSTKNTRYLSALDLPSSEDKPINYYFMLIPTASEMIRSELPAHLPTLNQADFIDQTYNKLDNFKTINCYDALAAMGKKAYYRTDHHWNSLGAYNGARSFLQATGVDLPVESEYNKVVVKEDFLGSLYAQAGGFTQIPDQIEIWQHQTNNLNNKLRCYDDKNKLIANGVYRRDDLFSYDPYRVFLGDNQGIITIDTGIENERNLLLIKDSYSNSMLPFLTSNYQRIYVVDMRFLDKSFKQLLSRFRVQDVLIAYNVDTYLTDNNIFKLVE